jgi:beta-glucosidase
MNTRTFLIIPLIFISLTATAQKKTKLDPKGKSEKQFIDELLESMTLEEKIGQLTLYTSGWDITGPSLNENYKEELRAGRVGSLFNAHGVKYNTDLQDIAVKETRLGIPLLFGYDVIHGHKTIFPIPLAEAASWDLALIEESARLASREAAASGLNWTFNPMVDIARDPRWGRVSEGSGEDTYLGSLIGVAKVKGHQGTDFGDPFTVLACVKHFAAYGAPLAGRDYGWVDMSERTLRETYLPPYKAAIDAGVATIMTSFNEVDGVPASGNSWLLQDILREEWGFEGFVVTDYTSINEMVPFGVVNDLEGAAQLALSAGVDMDMQGGVYNAHVKNLIDKGQLTEAQVEASARRILEMKWKLGLFHDPYLYLNEEREKETVRSEALRAHARLAAQKSIVLLKNDHYQGLRLLPLSKDIKNIAIIGPLGDNQMDVQGSWHASGLETDVVTIRAGIQNAVPKATVNFARGCDFEGDDKSGFEEALRIAGEAEVVILALGENYIQNGEAASRTNIDLPGVQNELVDALIELGKPMVALVGAGRPLTISELHEKLPAILNTWHLGTMHGAAVADVLFGDYNPSGKITMTFPRNVGQVPIFYNAKRLGRPFNPNEKYTSKYIDSPNTPLYPFGYGLSYTTFEYSDLAIDKSSMAIGGSVEVTVNVRNAGEVDGEEVVQLYIRDVVGSVTRPERELKGFEKIALKAGEVKTVKFTISSADLAFYTRSMEFKAEPGIFEVFVGTNSDAKAKVSFELTK